MTAQGTLFRGPRHHIIARQVRPIKGLISNLIQRLGWNAYGYGKQAPSHQSYGDYDDANNNNDLLVASFTTPPETRCIVHKRSLVCLFTMSCDCPKKPAVDALDRARSLATTPDRRLLGVHHRALHILRLESPVL
jgi:hypothetical protein